MEVDFVDIPIIHTFSDEIADQVMEALGETGDMEVFNQKIVRRLIEYKWPLVRKFTINRLFLPFVGFLAFFMGFMNFVYPNKDKNESFKITCYILMVPLTYFALYFLWMELK